MRPRKTGPILYGLVLLVALAPLAGAEHDSDHRYYVVGTVTDGSGEPLCGVTVRAADVSVASNADTNRTATTDGSGRYHIQLHLHSQEVAAENANVGDTLRVTVEGTSASRTVLAAENAGNPEGWGQQSVDLAVSDGRTNCLRAADLAIYGGVGALAAGGVVAAFLLLRRPRGGGRTHRELRSVSGVTRARARELDEAGVRSVKDLSEADPEALSKATSLTPKQARLFVKRAGESRGPKR